MAGLITKGLKLSYKTGSSSTYTDLTNLESVPDLGGDTEKIECTTLDDAAHMYINGLLNYGDSVEFTFVYEKTQFTTLNALTGSVDWKVTIPDGGTGGTDSTCTFSGECHVKFSGQTYNEVMHYTLSIAPTTAMTFA